MPQLHPTCITPPYLSGLVTHAGLGPFILIRILHLYEYADSRVIIHSLTLYYDLHILNSMPPDT
jgi:hypothetical protein